MKLGEHYRNRAFPEEKENPPPQLHLVGFSVKGGSLTPWSQSPGCCPPRVVPSGWWLALVSKGRQAWLRTRRTGKETPQLHGYTRWEEKQKGNCL